MILTILCPIILSILSIIILTYYAKPLNLLDIPNHRKQHDEPIAMIGGVAIYISLFITSLIINLPYIINVLIYASSIVLLIGLLNDIFNLGVVIRLIFQIIASIVVMLSGLAIVDIGEISIFGIISMGIFSGIFTSSPPHPHEVLSRSPNCLWKCVWGEGDEGDEGARAS